MKSTDLGSQPAAKKAVLLTAARFLAVCLISVMLLVYVAALSAAVTNLWMKIVYYGWAHESSDWLPRKLGSFAYTPKEFRKSSEDSTHLHRYQGGFKMESYSQKVSINLKNCKSRTPLSPNRVRQYFITMRKAHGIDGEARRACNL